MNQREQREIEIFNAALELTSPADRAAYLDRACQGEPALRHKVEALLRVHTDADALFEKATQNAGPGLVAASPVGLGGTALFQPLAEGPGTVIGRYKLLQLIGEGGFGAVYMAEQKEPVKRRVALKIIKLGMDTKQVVARFEAERQALALMDHPNIAKVLDAGATESGRPYFVMELVHGVSITQYCDENNLPPLDRLKLFTQVCHAIQHAHQKGIIHRDIKPSNILVTLHDGVPVPKVIDFGIAKATQQELTEKTLFTQFQQFIGTPAYMSPEQAEMSGLDIDTRSDIYALGVLLYELLTAKTPFDPKTLLAAGLDEMRRIIREQEPVRPSTRVSTMADGERTTVARHRQSEGIKLIHLLQGDLDWIVMKCLEKDRTRRYETANGLAQDIERHLNQEPVAARPPSTVYRVQKFVRRNKIMVSAAAAVATALVLGVLVSTWQAIRATRAEHEESVLRQQAQDEASRATKAEREQSRLRQQAQAQAYASDMKAAQVAVQQNNRGLALSLLERHLPTSGQADLRGIEWRYLWRQANGTETHSFSHTLGVFEVAFSPDGRVLATAAFDRAIDKVIQVWDIASEKQVCEFQAGGDTFPTRCLGFTADGRRFVFRASHGIEVHETSGWALLTNYPSSAGGALVLSRNGKRLVFQQSSRTTKALDLETWESWETTNAAPNVRGLALNSQGTLAAISPMSQTGHAPLFLWDIPGNSCVPLGEPSTSSCFAFSPDGQWLASGHISGEVALWDLRTRRRVVSWPAHQGWVLGLAFSPDGKYLASGGHDQVITLWEAGATNRLDQLTGHGGVIQCLNFSKDGQQLASASGDNTARIWDLQVRHSPDKAGGLNLPASDLPVCPSADGVSLFTLAPASNSVSLWSLQSGQAFATYSRNSFQPAEGGSLAYFLKQRLAVGIGTNGMLRIWDMTTGKPLRSVSLPVSNLRPACLSLDQRWLVANAGGRVLLFDLREGRQVAGFGFRYDSIFAADISPDSQLLAVAANPPTFRGDRDIHLWDLNRGRERLRYPDFSLYTVLRFSPDGKLLAAVDTDGDVQLWSVESGTLVWSALRGHGTAAASCSFSTDGKTLITSGLDATLRFWSVATGQELLLFQQALALSPNLIARVDEHGIYHAQTDVNPIPDSLVWQDLQRGTWRLSLPPISETDRIITRRRERLAEETRRVEARERREAELMATIAVAPGAIKEWLILGPIPLAADQTELQGLDADLVPNEAQLRPHAGDRLRAPGGELTWQPVRLTNYVADFVELLGPAEHAVVYAVCYVHLPAPHSDLRMLVGSDDQAKVYLNSKPFDIYRQPEGRALTPDENVIQGIELKAGLNVLVLKVVNGKFGWGGCIRFTDSAGNPVPGIEVQLNPP